jgi:hypothetical protein
LTQAPVGVALAGAPASFMAAPGWAFATRVHATASVPTRSLNLPIMRVSCGVSAADHNALQSAILAE